MCKCSEYDANWQLEPVLPMQQCLSSKRQSKKACYPVIAVLKYSLVVVLTLAVAKGFGVL